MASESQGPDVLLRAEELRVGVQQVPAERVIFTKRIVEITRVVEVPVRVEELVMTRVPLDESDAATFGNHPLAGDLEIVLHEEVPVISLSVQPVERVRVQVSRVQGQQAIEADLRREVAEVTSTTSKAD